MASDSLAPDPLEAVCPLSVLVIEDDLQVVVQAERSLTKRGAKVQGFTNAKAARAALLDGQSHYNIVISGLRMRDMTGISLLQECRHSPHVQHRTIPFILVAGRMAPAEMNLLSETDLVTVLVKPFAEAALLARYVCAEAVLRGRLSSENCELCAAWSMTHHLLKDNPDQVLARIDGFLQKFPTSLILRSLKAQALMQKKEMDAAKALLASVLKENPLYLRAMSLVAAMRNEEGRKAESLSLLEAAQSHSPLHANRGLTIAQLHMEMGNVEVAERQFKQILTNNPRSEDTLLGLAFCAVVRDRLDEARKIQKALSRPDALPAKLVEVAGHHSSVGDYDTALKLYMAGIKSLVNRKLEYVFHFNIALAHLKHENLRDAIVAVRSCRESAPPDFRQLAALERLLQQQSQKGAGDRVDPVPLPV